MSFVSQLVPVARSGVKAVAAGIDVVSRPQPGVTILIYHRVGAGSGGQMDLAPDLFHRQLAWLSEHCDVISLDRALELLASDSPLPHDGDAPPVVLTFDDGTADWVEHVLPALEAHRVPATFYVATSFIEDGTAFPGDGVPLSWAALGELVSSDLVTIGSHTHRHLLLDRLPAPDIADELDRSIDLLAERVGVEANHFAYPKAVLGSPEAEAAVRERFSSAVIAGTRANPPGVDPHRLHRSPIQAADSQRWFRRKAVGGMHVEDDLRRLANRARYRKLAS